MILTRLHIFSVNLGYTQERYLQHIDTDKYIRNTDFSTTLVVLRILAYFALKTYIKAISTVHGKTKRRQLERVTISTEYTAVRSYETNL